MNARTKTGAVVLVGVAIIALVACTLFVGRAIRHNDVENPPGQVKNTESPNTDVT